MLLSRTLRVALFAFAALAGVIVAGCGTVQDPWAGKGGPPRILTTIAPIDCFVRNVAGEHAGILCLCKTTGPHDYQYNIRDTLYLKKTNLFLSNGVGLDDSFVDRMVHNSDNAQLRTRKLGEGMPANLLAAASEHEHLPGQKHHHHGEYDPHLWLGIPQAIYMVQAIRDELKTIDPAHAADYDKNSSAYVERLKKLHQEGREKLKGLKAPIISFHESLTYFADSFGLKIGGSLQGGPGSDPDGPRLQQLITLCKETNARIITTEPQYKEDAALNLQRTLRDKGISNVVLVEVDPLETSADEEITADWYERKMRTNIDNLAQHAR